MTTRTLYREWIAAGAPGAGSAHLSELLRVSVLAAAVQGLEAMDDRCMGMAQVALCRRDSAFPVLGGADLAITESRADAVLVTPCVDGDVYCYWAKRGRPLVSVMLRTSLTTLEQSLAIVDGMAAPVLAWAIRFGWPRTEDVGPANDFLRELYRSTNPGRPQA